MGVPRDRHWARRAAPRRRSLAAAQWRGRSAGAITMEPEPRTPAAAPASRPPLAQQERKRQQEKLSGVVKSVHRRLRRKYREGTQAWPAAPPRESRGEGAGVEWAGGGGSCFDEAGAEAGPWHAPCPCLSGWGGGGACFGEPREGREPA